MPPHVGPPRFAPAPQGPPPGQARHSAPGGYPEPPAYPEPAYPEPAYPEPAYPEPGPGAYPDQGPGAYADPASWREAGPPPGAGPQSFPTGPVYPGAAPAFRPPQPGPGTPPAYGPPSEPPPYGATPPGPFRASTGSQPAVAYPPTSPAPTYPPSAYPLHGDQPYPPAAYGEPAYAPGPHDHTTTEVFDQGLLSGDPYGEARTGVIPVPPHADPDPRGTFGPPPDAFGPPPGGFAPPPGGFAPPPGGFAPPPGGFAPPHGGFGPPHSATGPGRIPDDHEAPLFSRLRRIRSHARQRGSRRWVVVVVVIALIGAVAGLRFWPGSPWYYEDSGGSPVAAPMPFQSVEITAEGLGTQGFLSWAYVDLRGGGTVVGSANMAEAADAGPMYTAWFGADLLRRAAEDGQAPSDSTLADVESMIRDEDLAAAERVVASLDGPEDSIGRLRTMCHLIGVTPGASWQDTAISAADAARMGACLADGRAAGAQWTPWLLNVMRQVRDESGIRQAFPSDERALIAITNGAVLSATDGQWQANCLAVSETWSLAILQQFPSGGDPNIDLAHVDAICQQVTQRLIGDS